MILGYIFKHFQLIIQSCRLEPPYPGITNIAWAHNLWRNTIIMAILWSEKLGTYGLTSKFLTGIYIFSDFFVRSIYFRYDDMLILPISRLEEKKKFPLECAEFEEQLTEICEQSRMILTKRWLPSCADIFLNYKQHWKQYIPRNATDSTKIIERFFDCVNMLLSTQLRWLMMKSLKHLVYYSVKFKVR